MVRNRAEARHAVAARGAALGGAAMAMALLVAGCALPPVAPTAGTQDPRRAVVQGTTPGITLVPARDASTAGGAAGATTGTTAGGASVGAATGATASGPAASAPGTGRAPGGFLQGLPPPSGRSLTQQKKLDAPQQGIPLPTAGSGGGTAR